MKVDRNIINNDLKILYSEALKNYDPDDLSLDDVLQKQFWIQIVNNAIPDGSKPVDLILPNERHFLKQSYLNAVRGLLYFRSSLLDTSQARLLPFHTIYSW